MSGWEVVTGTARGSAHAAGVGNQDRVAVRHVPTPSGPAVVAALADGHGGARHVRSEVGAQTAVDVAGSVLADALATREAPLAGLLEQSVPQIVQRWREETLAHVESTPLTADELDRLGPRTAPLIAYGATLLVAVVRDGEVALAQLGDGDVLARVDGGVADRPMPGDPRLVGGVTTSLCLDGAQDDFRYASYGPARRADLVILASDGYGNAFAAPGWHTAVVHDLADLVGSLGTAQVAQRLPQWLAESASVGGDDVTMALLVRTLTGPAPPLADAPVRRGRHRRGTGLALVAGLLVVGLAAGGVAWARQSTPGAAVPTGSSPAMSLPSPSRTPAPDATPAPTGAEPTKGSPVHATGGHDRPTKKPKKPKNNKVRPGPVQPSDEPTIDTPAMLANGEPR